MSVLPEFIIQQTLVRGFRMFREDDRLISVLFKNESQANLQFIKDFVQTQVIDFSLTYPREEVKVPAVVLLLRNETEAQGYLNDEKGDELCDDFEFDSILGNASTAPINQTVLSEVGPLPVLTATTNTITTTTGGS